MFRNKELKPEHIKVFRQVRDRIAKEAGGGDACWNWPKATPKDWPELPKRYSASRDGDGYGQFGFPGARYKPGAHEISYELDRQLTLTEAILVQLYQPDDDESEGAGDTHLGIEDVGRLKAAAPDGTGADHVRHRDTCEKCCINPAHLSRGKAYYNRLDEMKLKIVEGQISTKAKKSIPEVLSLWQPPGGYDKIAKALKITIWEVVAILLHYHESKPTLDYLLTDTEAR